jgi:hypothetical protein
MRFFRHRFFSRLAISALIATSTLAWSSPFIRTGAGFARMQAQSPDQPKQVQPAQPATSATFTGTIVRDGEQFNLRDASGATYKLDDADRAKPFEGKTVKVTGQLDTEAKLIHVETIEGVEA